MKILILTAHLNIGGISSYVVNLAKCLKAKGIDINVASSGGVLEEALQKENIAHFYINIKAKSELSPKVIKAAFNVISLLRQEKFELIHAQTRITQVVASIVNIMTGTPYVSTAHGFYKFRLSRKFFHCFGKLVIAVSRQVQEELKNKLYVKADKIKLIPHGIDIEKYSKTFSQEEKIELKKKLNLKLDSFIVGNIGRLAPEKGQKFLISAFSKVIKKHPNTELVIIGEGRLGKELLLQAKNLNVESKVHFFGERFDLENIYPLMDIFCFPSLRESFGFSVLEALVSGIPVVASNIGELRYLVEEDKNGFLCTPANPEELVLKINYLIENKELLAQMQKNALGLRREDFSISRMADEIISVYRQVLK